MLTEQSLHRVVGIGASAGGLEALQTFFDSMPVPCGMAIVVVQHLSPDFKSLMDELLLRHTKMRVLLAENDMVVEPDTVYLNPPRKDMIISRGKLLLSEKDPREKLTLPIDTFFRSLASDQGERAVAIILSGTGSDGSRSLQNVVDAGGLVIVQAEDTAAFDGMPKSAITTGLAHYIVPPERMAQLLIDEIGNGSRPASAVRLPAGTNPEPGTIQHIFRILQDEFGLDFTQYKPTTVGRRLERRMLLTNSNKVEDYVAKLIHDKSERNNLYHDLLIGVTQFFRDVPAFHRIARDVIPALVDNCDAEEEIRVWIPACATGEEVYTICILFREYIDRQHKKVGVKVFATDVHRDSLERGSAGIYAAETVESVDPALLKKYFTKEEDYFLVSPAIRQMVAFAPQNLLRDPPFTRIDLLICRNLLIYFELQAQQRVLTLFHFSVRTNGYLFLGPSESLGKLEEYFEEVDRHWKIYRKHRDARLPAEMRRPMPATVLPPLGSERRGGYAYSEQAASLTQQMRLYDALLSDFMPPGILFSRDGQLLHAFGDTKSFLEPLRGRPRLDISEMLVEDLRLPFASALERVRKSGDRISLTGILVKSDLGGRLFDLEIRAVDALAGPAEHYLAVIKDVAEYASRDDTPTEGFRFDEESRRRLESLEKELQYTKEHLRTTIEELETSNEELQASNEELLASNEELQSTNEELHSLNEELYTVNSEHQAKISELMELTNDMNNLTRSTNIGTLFVDANLQIRRFTPAAAQLFNILKQDIGRSVEHFSSKLDSAGFIRDLRDVLDGDRQIERSMLFADGESYLMRVVPYRTEKGIVEGAVATFIDITSLRQAEAALARQSKLLEMVLDTVADGVVAVDGVGHFNLFNRAAEGLLGLGPKQVEAKQWPVEYGLFRSDEVTPIKWEELPLVRAINGETALRFECYVRNEGLERGRHISVSAAPIPAIGEEKAGAVCTFHDITQRVERFRRLEMSQTDLEQAVRDKSEKLEISEARSRLALEAAEMGTWFYDSRSGIYRRSAEFNRILGLAPKDTESSLEEYLNRVFAEDRNTVSRGMLQATMAPGEYQIEFRIQRSDGTERWLRDKGQIVQSRDDGSVVMAGAVVDISDLKSANDLMEAMRVRLEKTVETRSAELEGIYGAMPAGYIMVDGNLRVLRANSVMARMHGISPEACQGKRFCEVAGASTLAFEACLQKVVESGQALYNVELRGTLPGYPGESRVLSVTCFPVPTLDGARGASAILADHTTLARCQKDLAEQRQLVEVVVESLKVVVCQWDVPSDTAEWGPFFTEAFGHPSGHITEAYAWWLNRIHPDDRAGFSEAFQQYQSTGSEDGWECTYSFQRANGTYAHVRHWFTAIRTADGRAERLLGAILDLTEENRLMSRLMQRNKDLETLVYIISHDLKEPLRSIRTFTDLLASEHAEHLNREGLDLLERLGRNSFRLDKLINEVLELSRAQQLEVPDQGTDGRALVMQAIAQLQDAIDAFGATVRVADQMPNVRANERWATQAVYNFIHNALKFCEDGCKPEIDIYPYAPVGDEPPMKGFVVADRGAGVPEELRDRIFELFRKGERRTDGTGAGLAIVREVARRHNGNAWHRPRSGGGSEFIITFGEGGAS